MKVRLRGVAVIVTAGSAAVSLAACGFHAGSGAGSGEGDGPSIGLLLPEATAARWEARDRPLLEKEIERRCGDCVIEHANARSDVALQQKQMDSMIARGVDAIVLAAVDARAIGTTVGKAAQAGIPVISYDRLAAGPIAGHVSFDAEEVGRLQGSALLRGMGERASDGQIVMMNGDPSDPNTAAFEKGALSVLTGRVKIGKTYDTLQWRTETAHMNMSGAIAALGAGNIDGVYAANDGLAAGVVSALRANNVEPPPPVTGQDAELAAVRRILDGRQYMTVYKPFGPEAAGAAAMAVASARGEGLARIATDTVRTRDGTTVPAITLAPSSVTADTIADTLVKDGVYTVRQLCAPHLGKACGEAGLT
ncbi:substrate-binding domain-containing protein [Streptomyces sp. NPDC088812]|uniref:substrate-binding domain-containing protein n=1 Tax=Streptomyces sp. NPDC088812 TaxID=3365905 RepID=UPI0037F8C541